MVADLKSHLFATLEKLKDQKHTKKNYLFLKPVSLEYFPDYDAVISKPMDYSTMESKIASSEYRSTQEFWEDAYLILDNCVAYNSRSPDSNWVVKTAEDMRKVTDKTRSQMDKKWSTAVSKAAAKKTSPKSRGRPKAAKSPTPSATSSPWAEPPPSSSTEGLSHKLIPSSSLASPIRTTSGMSSASFGSRASSTGPLLSPPKPKLKLSLRPSTPTPGISSQPLPYEWSVDTHRKPFLILLSTLRRLHGASTSTLVGDKIIQNPFHIMSASVPNKFAAEYNLKVSLYDTETQFQQSCDSLSAVEKKVRLLGVEHLRQLAKSDPSALLVPDYEPLYKSSEEVIYDLRATLSNRLRFFPDNGEEILEVYKTLNHLIGKFVGPPGSSYPSLLPQWETLLMQCIAKILSENKGQFAIFFRHPVQSYYGGILPPNYADRIGDPMDFGTLTHNLLTGAYSSIDEFHSDLTAISENCVQFYLSQGAAGQQYVDTARKLRGFTDEFMNWFKGNYMKLPVPPTPDFSVGVLTKNGLRHLIEALKHDSFNSRGVYGTTEAFDTFRYFLMPVSSSDAPDYTDVVNNPLCLEDISKRIATKGYLTPELFESDIQTIIDNCVLYNSIKGNFVMLEYADAALKAIKRIMTTYVKKVMDGRTDVVEGRPGSKKRGRASEDEDEGAKRRRTLLGQSAVATASSAAFAPSGGPGDSRSAGLEDKKSDGPADIHTLIFRLRNEFKGRIRDAIDLDTWEVDCMTLLKKLLEHRWLRGKGLQVIFTCPVLRIWPELTDAYNEKIDSPMDLTTVECKLLCGDYRSPAEFINEILLVFSNAMMWNSEGFESHDVLPSMYYEAAEHLSKYVKWLTVLGKFEGWWKCLPPDEDAHPSMEEIYMSEERRVSGFELSRPRDKQKSQTERSIQKIVDTLKNTKNRKNMESFIAPVYPADYDAVVVKRMDLAEIMGNLDKRKYLSYKAFIDDIRLIFSNAHKYNERFKEVSPISKAICEAANVMSEVVEKMIVQLGFKVSDSRGVGRVETRNTKRIEIDRKNESKRQKEEAAKDAIDAKEKRLKELAQRISDWEDKKRQLGLVETGRQESNWEEQKIALEGQLKQLEKEKADVNKMESERRAEMKDGMEREEEQKDIEDDDSDDSVMVYSSDDEDEGDGADYSDDEHDGDEDDGGDYIPLRRARMKAVGVTTNDEEYDVNVLNEEAEREEKERRDQEMRERKEETERQEKMRIEGENVFKDAIGKLFNVLAIKINTEGDCIGDDSMDMDAAKLPSVETRSAIRAQLALGKSKFSGISKSRRQINWNAVEELAFPDDD